MMTMEILFLNRGMVAVRIFMREDCQVFLWLSCRCDPKSSDDELMRTIMPVRGVLRVVPVAFQLSDARG
jgi:hypothetical protein